MMMPDDSPGPDTDLATMEDPIPAADDAGSATAVSITPIRLWRSERGLPGLIAAGAERARISAALDRVVDALARAEAGADPLPGTEPPATLAELISAASTLAGPLAEAFSAPDAAADTRAALHAGLTGWMLALIAARLGPAARDHGRSMVPAELTRDLPDFAGRHIASARAGHGVDRDFLGSSLPRVRAIADAAWRQLAGTEAAPAAASEATRRALVGLLEHARLRLRRLEHWHYESCLDEPDGGGPAAWRVGLMLRVGQPVWHPPLGVPPRPVVDDITVKPAPAPAPADADPPAHDRGVTDPADESARADDAA
jgi:hypothetical protein